MKYLFVKFARDIRKLWPQFVSVMMMAMISTTIFTGMSAVWNGMKQSADSYYSACNLADVWVYGTNFTAGDLEEIRKLDSIQDVAESAAVTLTKGNSEIHAVTISDQTKPVLNPLVRSGAALDSGTKGIWLDEDYAEENSIQAGDTISAAIGDKTWEIPVEGIVLDAENLFYIQSAIDSVPDHVHNGYAYLSEAYARELFGEIPYTQLRISLNRDIDKQVLTEDMKTILGERYYTLQERSDKITIWQIENEQEQIQKMAMLFSAVFLVLSLLTMYTTMSRLVDNQIIQIGTLKALGFQNRQIYLHYALYGFVVAFLGGILGHILGLTVVSPIVLGVKQATLTLPEWKLTLAPEAIAMWVLIVVICTASAVLTSRKIIKVVPAQTIQGQVPQQKQRTAALKRSRLPYAWLWTVRGIRLHKARYAMGVIAAAGSIVLMTAGFGVWDSLTESYNDVYENLYTYDYAATIKTGGYEALSEKLSSYKVQYAQTTDADFGYDGQTQSGMITVLSAGDFMNLYEDETALNLQNSGVCLTQKLAGELGVLAGDVIAVREQNSSETKTLRVAHIVSAKLPQGIFVSADSWESFSPTVAYFTEDAFQTAQSSGLLSGIISRADQRENADEMINSVRSVMMILIFAAFLLSAVVLYNLGTLNFIERYKEYATMKVLGFYKRELRGMVLKDILLTLAAGLILGIPASFAFLNVYIQVVSMDGMEWSPYIMPAKFVLVLVLVSGFSVAIGLLVAHKIRRVDMVEAMKSAE